MEEEARQARMRAFNLKIHDNFSSRGTCPNCSSKLYYTTTATENCPACGLFFDYWGEGGNDVYEKYKKRKDTEDSWDALMGEDDEESY